MRLFWIVDWVRSVVLGREATAEVMLAAAWAEGKDAEGELGSFRKVAEGGLEPRMNADGRRWWVRFVVVVEEPRKCDSAKDWVRFASERKAPRQ